MPCKNQDWRKKREEINWSDWHLRRDLIDGYIKSIRVTLEDICTDTNRTVRDRFETVPEKVQEPFKNVEQNNTLRATFRQFCREGLNTTTLLNKGNNEVLSVKQNLLFYTGEAFNIMFSTEVCEFPDHVTELLTNLIGANNSCTDLITLGQESATTIQNFLSFAIEVFEATNTSNIGTRFLEKLLRLLRFTVQLKEQWELPDTLEDCIALLV